ncbi:hypothetical protein [Streptomyces spiramenti]|uniref:Uncharacterized protein n=1 Tax=Streptomyces spiramenti TaxID=2720606 RepID=A0ABX1AUD1_9ACTN|nr:hypothetical protein [Streptomyces spiramenti]NJP69231.1 hypothetical protein [Streptomyces spiramenti]
MIRDSGPTAPRRPGRYGRAVPTGGSGAGRVQAPGAHSRRDARAAAAPFAAAGVCALLVPLLSAGPAHALDEPRTPVAYATAADAEPVEGTAGSADAPALEAGGIYTDELDVGDALYYSLVLDAESDVYISAVAAPDPGTKVASGDGFELALTTTGGDTCASPESRTFQRDGAARPIAASQIRTVAPDGRCREAGNHLVRLTRTSAPTSTPAAWPVELRVMAEPAATGGTDVLPEDDWTTSDDLPPAPSGQAERAPGGSGFNDARSLEPGVWRDDLPPGATRFYAVPVDWHQQLDVRVELSNAPQREGFGSVINALGVDVYTPYRAPAAANATTSYSGEPAELALLTQPVAYDNRFETGFDRYLSRSRVAGWHYIAVHLHEDIVERVDAESVGMTLRIALHNEPGTAPTYDGDLAEAGFGVDEEALDQEGADGGTDQVVAAGRDETKEFLGYAGIGAGVALLGVVGTWYFLARRDAAAGHRAG